MLILFYSYDRELLESLDILVEWKQHLVWYSSFDTQIPVSIPVILCVIHHFFFYTSISISVFSKHIWLTDSSVVRQWHTVNTISNYFRNITKKISKIVHIFVCNVFLFEPYFKSTLVKKLNLLYWFNSLLSIFNCPCRKLKNL